MGHAVRLEVRDDTIALITFGQPGRKVNALTREFLREFSEVVACLEKRAELKGVLFRSGKPGQFVAGADLHEMAALQGASREEIDCILDLGLGIFNRIARLPFPSVALIDGPCLGGGLELALAMDGRIASSSPGTILGCPEIKVGLIPGWGGTQRLPRLIGESAIEMLGSGEPISAAKAGELALIDDVVSADELFDRGIRWLDDARATGSWRNRRHKVEGVCKTEGTAFEDLTANATPDGSSLQGVRRARQQVLRAIHDGIRVPLDEGLAVEREAAHEVFGSSDASNLIAVFFLKSRRAKDSGVDDPNIVPLPIRRVGIVGAGQMGAGIAEAHARAEIPVVLVDVDDARLKAGIDRVRAIQDRRASRKETSSEAWKGVLDRISTSTDLGAFSGCDLVVEAVTENETIKAGTFRKLAGNLSGRAIVASNTSTIPIGRMAASAPDPSRFAGMHFFHPVERMELVEVIRGPESGDEAIATLVALAKRLGKIPIVVRDCPGFLTTRLLAFYLREAVRLIEEGVDPAKIDIATVGFGMPMGPITLMDFIGLDTVSAIFEVMAAGYPGRAEPSPLVAELVKAGRLGRKTNAGFHLSGKQGANADPILDCFRTAGGARPDASEIVDRLFLAMLLEATRVLEEGIVREPADVDLGVILGLSFPAHLGGLLRWADQLGAGTIIDRLSKLERLGERFRPTERLKRMAETGESFYGER